MSDVARSADIDITDASTWPELLTVPQAARVLQMTEEWVREQVRAGEFGDALRFGDRGMRIRKRDLLLLPVDPALEDGPKE